MIFGQGEAATREGAGKDEAGAHDRDDPIATSPIFGPDDDGDACEHPPQEPPGYRLERTHHSIWCDTCARAIWYEDEDPA
jgi:hypothetical protein